MRCCLLRRRAGACFRRCGPLGRGWANQRWCPSPDGMRGVCCWGALNGRTAHRVVVRWPSETSPGARAFLTEIRRRYRSAPTTWLLLDQGPAHTAAPTRRLAAELGIEFVWLPRQWPEWNAMDQLWREWKRLLAANRQAASIEDLAEQAEAWVLGLRPREALRQAGILSPRFWLKHLLQSFWQPT
jgi:transposase InsO family protein